MFFGTSRCRRTSAASSTDRLTKYLVSMSNTLHLVCGVLGQHAKAHVSLPNVQVELLVKFMF